MTKIKNICVYCGASSRASEHYLKAAEDVGRFLAENDIGLIYGGGRLGLMGKVADSILSHGGKAVGIIPKHLQDREERHDELSELHIVDTMHIRKQMMTDRSDAFLILPGGFGTLEEAFEILTWKQLGLHTKPILFLNINNFWGPLQALKQHLFDEAFIKDNDMSLFSIIDDIGSILPEIRIQIDAQNLIAAR